MCGLLGRRWSIPETTHTGAGRTCKVNTERGSTPESFRTTAAQEVLPPVQESMSRCSFYSPETCNSPSANWFATPRSNAAMDCCQVAVGDVESSLCRKFRCVVFPLHQLKVISCLSHRSRYFSLSSFSHSLFFYIVSAYEVVCCPRNC